MAGLDTSGGDAHIRYRVNLDSRRA
jgi:hypothetical protein